jgi:hypothetical protein
LYSLAYTESISWYYEREQLQYFEFNTYRNIILLSIYNFNSMTATLLFAPVMFLVPQFFVLRLKLQTGFDDLTGEKYTDEKQIELLVKNSLDVFFLLTLSIYRHFLLLRLIQAAAVK